MTDISHHCPQAGTLRLVVQGPLTIYDAQAMKNRLLELLSEVPLQALELDLAQVPEIDTSGVQWLLLAAREAQRYQASVRTLAASEAVYDTLEFCRLGPVLGLATTQA